MTKTLMMAIGAALLVAAAHEATASCASDAAEARQECLGKGPRDPTRTAECGRFYRDDLAECQRYEHASIPTYRPPMPVQEAPPPPLAPHH